MLHQVVSNEPRFHESHAAGDKPGSPAVSPDLGGDLSERRRSAAPVIGRALEGVRELEDAPVVAGAPDDLQSDRETLSGEAAGTEMAG